MFDAGTDRMNSPTAGAPTALRQPSTPLQERFSPEELIRIYRWMLLSRKLDDKEIQLKNQSQIFFQISGAGHEAILVAAGTVLRPGYDWFFPYYRDRALCLVLGVTPYEMLLQAVGAKDDPASGGRQMPSHWGSKRLNIASQGSPTGMQCLQAVGCAEAALLYEQIEEIPGRETRFHPDEVAYVSVGDGTTSEGEFWESLNTACARRLPVVYLVEDNGYAISVPVEVQTAGGDASRLVEGFPGLAVIRTDGTDFQQSLEAMEAAVDYMRAPGAGLRWCTQEWCGPIRTRYRTTNVCTRRRTSAKPRHGAIRSGNSPRCSVRPAAARDSDLDEVARQVEAEINEAAARALAAPKPPKDTAALWVYSPDVDPTSPSFSDRPGRKESPTRWWPPSTGH
jgi:2-oxoisovalerate dehydrogenase E1 component